MTSFVRLGKNIVFLQIQGAYKLSKDFAKPYFYKY